MKEYKDVIWKLTQYDPIKNHERELEHTYPEGLANTDLRSSE